MEILRGQLWLNSHSCANPMGKCTMRGTTPPDIIEYSHIQCGHNCFGKHNIFHLSNIDMSVQFSVKVETNLGIFRTSIAQSRQNSTQLIRDNA